MASTKSRFSASSGVSRPATSESEGLFHQYNLEGEDAGEDQDDDIPDASITVQTSKKKGSVAKKKRDDALKSEVCLPYLQSKFFSSNVLP